MDSDFDIAVNQQHVNFAFGFDQAEGSVVDRLRWMRVGLRNQGIAEEPTSAAFWLAATSVAFIDFVIEKLEKSDATKEAQKEQVN